MKHALLLTVSFLLSFPALAMLQLEDPLEDPVLANHLSSTYSQEIATRAMKGSSQDQFRISELYKMAAKGPEKDAILNKADAWLNLAVKQGNADAAYHISHQYLTNIMTSPQAEFETTELEKNIKLLLLAAQQGHQYARELSSEYNLPFYNRLIKKLREESVEQQEKP